MRFHLLCLSLAILLAFVPLALRAEDTSPRVGDLFIYGGQVIDGTGAPARLADVLVRDGRIQAIVPREKAEERPDLMVRSDVQSVNAIGKVIAPGFIDTHAHGDPFRTPTFENFAAQGVTTIVLGQDGSGAFDADPVGWMERVETEAKLAINIAAMTGHGTVRSLAGTGTNPTPTPEELAEMVRLVEEAMVAGCFGMTTGLEYEPGRFAALEELAAVARPVAAHGGVVMSHTRNEDVGVVEDSVRELLEQGRLSGAAVHLSHSKVVFGKGAEPAESVLALMDAARAAGQRVTGDVYPYTASFTTIGIVFPDWARPPVDFEEIKRTRREELAEYLRNRVNKRNGPGATLIGTKPYAGKTLEQVAAELGKPFEDVLIDDIGPEGASAAYFVMDEATMLRFLRDPHTNICSDGSPGMRHPRGYGAFAKVLRLTNEGSSGLTLEEAVRKMSGLPAETLGLDKIGRGFIREGYAADLVVFDPAAVRDNATFEEPQRLATGIAAVLVNGTLIRSEDVATGEAPPGEMLRRGR